MKNEIVTSFLIEGYEPDDLLRLSKDAFYDVIEQEFLKYNDNKHATITEAKLSFMVETVEYTDFVHIQVEVTDYEMNEE